MPNVPDSQLLLGHDPDDPFLTQRVKIGFGFHKGALEFEGNVANKDVAAIGEELENCLPLVC